MKHSCLQVFPLLTLAISATSFAQIQKAPSATVVTSSSPTLRLPGSVTLTTTVSPTPQFPIGAPSGSVQIIEDGKLPLGTAPLNIIPATQNFSFPAIQASFGYSPYGIFTFPSGTSKYSVLGMIDATPPVNGDAVNYPRLSIYSGQGAQILTNPVVYPLQASGINTFLNNAVDGFAVADFNKDGYPDILIHGLNGNAQDQYYLLPGKAGAAFDTNAGVVSADNSGISCDCETPQTEALTAADFNGDGYPDVAYAAVGTNSQGIIGVALNAGATAPGSFTTFVTAPTIPANLVNFQPAAIASGNFTSSGYPDIAVAGSYVATVTTGYVALFLNKGPIAGVPSFANPVLFPVAAQPNSIATADFRANGTTDVVVLNSSFVTGASSVQVLFGDGKGNLTTSSTVSISPSVASVSVADMNNDGFPDIIAVGSGGDNATGGGALYLLLNDGTGHFSSAKMIAGPSQGSYSTIGDFNGDGLNDLAELTFSPITESEFSAASVFLNSASSQAVFVTPAHALPAGIDSLNAEFPGDANFLPSISDATPIAVSQTAPTLTWPEPAAMEYGVPISATQLDAQSNVPGAISYSVAPGVILKPGTTKITATLIPTDIFDYTGATATQTITVTTPTLTGISPASGNLGSSSTTITVKGQGFVKGAVVLWNNLALSTTWVSLNEVTAVVPESYFAKTGTASITVADPNNITVAGKQIFTIIAPPATATATAPTTVEAGQGASLTLTVNPYPAAVTATLTLAFTPDAPNTVDDPNILFPNNKTTETLQIAANSTAAIPAIDFSTGSTAGTITLTVKLVASGVDVTPATLLPVSIEIRATPPVINSVTLDRSGHDLIVSVTGLSSTRDMTQAQFHFTAASGSSLKTTDLTVDLTTAFSGYYSSARSDAFGTTFLYMQPFTLSSDAKSIGSVTVILTNSKGASQPGTAQ